MCYNQCDEIVSSIPPICVCERERGILLWILLLRNELEKIKI